MFSHSYICFSAVAGLPAQRSGAQRSAAQPEFGYGGECLPTSKCHDVLHETRGFWHALVSGERENTEGLALPSARSYLS